MTIGNLEDYLFLCLIKNVFTDIAGFIITHLVCALVHVCVIFSTFKINCTNLKYYINLFYLIEIFNNNFY